MDQRIIDLYDEYTHGGINRRTFLDRLATLVGSAAAAGVLLPFLQNNYALAQTVAEDDPRISTQTVDIPGGQDLKGYLVKPKAGDKLPAILLIHENRGVNPHIEDVARRLGTEGYLTLALDFLSPYGGTPEDEDQARELFRRLQQADATGWARAGVAYLKGRPDSSGKVGAIGFCWGGGVVNSLATAEPDLDAGVSYYGRQPDPGAVPQIRAPLLLHYAGLDEGTNRGVPAFEAALRQAGKDYEIHMYEGANHAFNNDTSPARYNKEAADLAWARTLAFLRKHLM